MGKTNLAQSITKRRMDYLSGMLTGGQARSRKEVAVLAKKFGVVPKTVQNWMKHPENMSIMNFYRMADELDLKITVEFKDIPE